MRQAAEVASQRDGGDGWAGIGSMLSATASIVAALRSNNPNNSPVTTQAAVRFIADFFRGTFGRHGFPASALAMASHGWMPFLVVVLR